MSRPRLLDLFSGAGGATRGYQQAGFEVTGVDLRLQRHYPGEHVVQAEALEYLAEHGHEFQAVHASPPCQAWSAYRRRGDGVGAGYPDLIGPVRDALLDLGRPFAIENVEGAPLLNPTLLCGSMFRLDVRRHRGFETSFPLPRQACEHHLQTPRFPHATNRTNLRKTVEVGARRIPTHIQRAAMGIDWMSREELSQAVPPAYTHYVGTYMRRHLRCTTTSC